MVRPRYTIPIAASTTSVNQAAAVFLASPSVQSLHEFLGGVMAIATKYANVVQRIADNPSVFTKNPAAISTRRTSFEESIGALEGYCRSIEEQFSLLLEARIPLIDATEISISLEPIGGDSVIDVAVRFILEIVSDIEKTTEADAKIIDAIETSRQSVSDAGSMFFDFFHALTLAKKHTLETKE